MATIMLNPAVTAKMITTGTINEAAKPINWNKYERDMTKETTVMKTLLIKMLAKLITLLNLAVNSPVLYFLKKEAGRDKTRIIVASLMALPTLIVTRVLIYPWIPVISNCPTAADTTYIEVTMNRLRFFDSTT